MRSFRDGAALLEPAAAVAFAGLFKLVRAGIIKPTDTVVVNCTGHTVPAEQFLFGEGWTRDVDLQRPGFAPTPQEGLLSALNNVTPNRFPRVVVVDDTSEARRLIRRILQSWPLVRARLPELRMILVAGPRIDPRSLAAPAGVDVRAFVPDLDRHLAACDLALVQGGLTTSMELTAAGTPFLYFPLKNHFEQNFHVAHRLDRYGAGRRLEFATATPDTIAEAMLAELKAARRPRPVEADGAARAARMLADLI